MLIILSVDLAPSVTCGGGILYCPAGVKSRLPSGAKVRRRKKEVYVSLAYRLAFLIPVTPNGFGEFSIGLTAGKGIDGAGEADRRIDGEEPKDERRLCEIAGGFMGSAKEEGVPGIDGAGETGFTTVASSWIGVREPRSGGAGLLEDIRRPGKSILVTLLC